MDSGSLTIMLIVFLVLLCVACCTAIGCTIYQIFAKFEEGYEAGVVDKESSGPGNTSYKLKPEY